jgi:hypothetical protein
MKRRQCRTRYLKGRIYADPFKPTPLIGGLSESVAVSARRGGTHRLRNGLSDESFKHVEALCEENHGVIADVREAG